MTTIAVLDDNTRDANVIGKAETADQAADVFMAYMGERMTADDFADLERPSFARRSADTLDKGLRDECADGAFEPMW